MTRNHDKDESALPAPVKEGLFGRIVLLNEAREAYDKLECETDELPVKQRTQLKRYFERFCDVGPQSLDDQQFKFEKRCTTKSGTKIAIWAFKPFKWRLYGTVINYAGKQTFVGAVVNEQKKKDKANKSDFDKATKLLEQYAGQPDDQKRRKT